MSCHLRHPSLRCVGGSLHPKLCDALTEKALRCVVVWHLAWIPMQGKLANKMSICSKILYCVVVLVLDFTPRSAEVPGWHYPKTSRKRLFPSHGTAASV